MMTSSPASPAAHPHAGPADTHRPVGRFAALRRITERVGHDSAYVFPGFFISLFAFIVLVPLFAFSVGTIIIWVGALLLPLTLLLSRAFAQLSRTRLRLWGAPLATPAYRPRQPGVFGWVKSVADPRSWLDLVFETLIAFPLQTVTFVIAVTWWAGALGGLTYLAWGVFLPAEDTGLLELIVSALTGDALTLAPGLVFLLEVVVRFVIGLVLLLALPWIMRGLAHLDAVVTTAALGTSVFEGGAAPVAGTAAREGTPAEAGSPTAPGEPSASAGSRGPAAPPAGHASGTADASPTSSGSSTDPHLGPFASVDGWAWLTAGFAAVALTAIGWPVLAAVYGVPVVVAMILALAHGAALVLTVRWSLVGLVGNVAAILATALLTQSTLGLPWPWPVTTMLTHCLVVLLLGLRHPWFVALVAWATGTAAPVAAVVMHRPDGLAGTLDSLLIAGSVSAGAAIVGVVIRQLVRSRSALRTERRATSELSARQRELQERNRIAQELHDVVAHSMSVISVQATTAEYRLPDVDPQTGEEFASIADSSRRALSEMRGLLAILRVSAHRRGRPARRRPDRLPHRPGGPQQRGPARTGLRDRRPGRGGRRPARPRRHERPRRHRRSRGRRPAAARKGGRPRFPAARRPGCRAGSGRDPRARGRAGRHRRGGTAPRRRVHRACGTAHAVTSRPWIWHRRCTHWTVAATATTSGSSARTIWGCAG